MRICVTQPKTHLQCFYHVYVSSFVRDAGDASFFHHADQQQNDPTTTSDDVRAGVDDSDAGRSRHADRIVGHLYVARLASLSFSSFCRHPFYVRPAKPLELYYFCKKYFLKKCIRHCRMHGLTLLTPERRNYQLS